MLNETAAPTTSGLGSDHRGVGGKRIAPVILSGGAGTRLWPLSRTLHPKQFLPLAGRSDSLLLAALRRNAAPERFAPPIVVCAEEHRFLAADEIARFGSEAPAIVLEPAGRNTAPAAVVAALLVARTDPAGLMLLAPSDHVVRDDAGYQAAVAAAAAAAADGALVTFGVVPDRPETGYGYIRQDESRVAPGCFRVARFVEKPDADTARRFLAEGGYLWNSGMFVFRADAFLAEAERLEPGMVAACRTALDRARADMGFLWLDRDAFLACPAAAIDTAVMERTDRAAVVPVDIGWSDLGSWDSLWSISPKDAHGNFTHGDAVAADTRDSYLWSDDRLVATLGVDGLIVVATSDAVLVCARDRAQEVKGLVELLKARGRDEPHTHVLVRRPWGAYESLSTGDRFQVKRLVVNPGRRLSIQLHHHRSEHWVVVRGTARVLVDGEERLLFENQSTYIAAGTRHRLENPGRIPLEIIEVQSGSYLGEDDIVRFADDFGRN